MRASSRRCRATGRGAVLRTGLRSTGRSSRAAARCEGAADQEVEYRSPAIPGLARLRVTVTQRETVCSAEALVTITDSLEAALSPAVITTRGLPGYTFERAAGELWRCRFDAARNIIVVNSSHRDFVFATRNRSLQLRYLVRLYVKELVLKNFAGLPSDQLLERMVELSLHAEANLKGPPDCASSSACRMSGPSSV